MESAVIVEGFLRSEMYRAKYSKLVADGDSSVYQRIIEMRPYDDVTVEKIECRNHLLRNYCNKLKEIATTSIRDTVTSFDKGIHIRLRKLIGSSLMRLRTAVTKAIAHRKNEEGSLHKRSNDLRRDIMNGPSHVFGQHHRCAELKYFCKGSKSEEVNHVPEMIKCGLYNKIMTAVGALADQSKHLVQDVDSNRAEHYNSAVARLIGGKRVNYCKKGSYQARCAAAVVAFNSGRAQYKLHKKMYKKSPGKFTKLLEDRSKRRVLLARLKRKAQPKTRRRLVATSTPKASKDYGPLSEKPDLDEDIYKEKVKLHLRNLKKTEEERRQLEECTRDQSDSELWREERRIRITASNFGTICNRKPYSNSAPIVSSLLYSCSWNSAAVQYGRQHEPTAISQLSAKIGKPIKKCGLFIDEELNFLGATPDGLIEEDGIVEIKCPFTGKDLTPEEVIEQKRGVVGTLYSKPKLGNTFEMKKRHIYHFQIQGQLHITRRRYCIFVIWTPSGIKIDTILRDDQFWREEMEPKLVAFYTNCLLPELVDPRRRRSMPIREPQEIKDAQKKREEKQLLAKPLVAP